MGSPPGTYVLMASNAQGVVQVTLNFDPVTGNLRNVGSPARCLVASNATGIPWPCRIVTPQGTFQQNIPVGTTDFTAAQIANASGITNRADIEFGL